MTRIRFFSEAAAQKTPYENNASELSWRLYEAIRETNLSGSFSALLEEKYVKGAILAQSEGLKPPFEPNTKVRSKNKCAIHTSGRPVIEAGVIKVVKRVFYEGEGKWTVELQDDSQDLFCEQKNGRLLEFHSADDFESA